MDAPKKWLIIWFTPHPTTTLRLHLKMDVLQKTFFLIILAAQWLVQHLKGQCHENFVLTKFVGF